MVFTSVMCSFSFGRNLGVYFLLVLVEQHQDVPVCRVAPEWPCFHHIHCEMCRCSFLSRFVRNRKLAELFPGQIEPDCAGRSLLIGPLPHSSHLSTQLSSDWLSSVLNVSIHLV